MNLKQQQSLPERQHLQHQQPICLLITSPYQRERLKNVLGALAVAVPGEIKGYWEMYKKYGGKAPWKELFVDAIKMCEEGIPVSKPLAGYIMNNRDGILRIPGLRKRLENDRGELAEAGDIIKLPSLARTLRIIAEEGADAFYNGSLTAGLVKDIQDNGGIITKEDLNSYKVRWEEPVHVQLSSGINFYSVGPPASGQLLGFMLRVLNNTLKSDMDKLTNISIITETFKHAFAMRSHFGDPYFTNISEVLEKINDQAFIDEIKLQILSNQTHNDPADYGANYYNHEDMGTGNIALIAPNGDAVAATSTINTLFGSWFVSESTGILMNNQMDDFSTPGLVNSFGVYPSDTNFIEPGKRPQSSMCPSILVDQNGDVCLVVGAAGGTKITTSTALTIIRNIWHHESIVEAVEGARFHHQLMPMNWYYEPSMSKDVVLGMEARGHNATLIGHSGVVTAVTRNGEIFGAASDMRRPGNTSYLLLPCTCTVG
ncbi:glutathione hydrolase 1 proenzyme isoform X2 [Halyomorpha halys]|uniref:glutathione hydrolase 1 proenzyme isoform X2 n=1 Tax=Halyomorpha halys TaxID=286706 RepID=UPI0006D504DB|nr:glutathione hydrolase 1 proenzyme isoform X2 [Halyomorpha halys]